MTAAEVVERCPQCDGPMVVEWLRDHEAFVCPVDATAFAVEQDDDEGWDL